MPRHSASSSASGWILPFLVFLGTCFNGWPSPPNYIIRTWQMENGLPQNKVTAVLQTRDSYLWLGTYSGLARFDGVGFTVFDENNTPALHSSRVTSLYQGPDEILWIGDESGRITQYHGGEFKAVPIHPAWRGGKIYAITADDAGDVWLMDEAGELARVRDGLVLQPQAGLVTKVVSLARTEDGVVWIAREGIISRLFHGKLATIDLLENHYIQGIGAARDHGLWVATDGRIKKWREGEWLDFGPAPWDRRIIARLIETGKGALLAGTSDNGAFMVFPGLTNSPTVHFDHFTGLPSNWILSIREDREKNLWFGTGAGLVAIRPSNVETIFPPDQWQSCPLLSVCAAANGALWVGTEGAGLYRFQEGLWTNYNSREGIGNPFVWSLAQDSTGCLWAGTWGGGLFVQTNGAFHRVSGMETLTPPMPALLSAPGEMWIGTTAGLLHYQNGQVAPVSPTNGENADDVRAVARDQNGAIWFGTAGNGLACLQNQTVRHYRLADGLSSDFIECLHFDASGALWIGTFGGGLDRFKKGRFSTINRHQGLPNSIIGDIEPDGRGFFWMTSYGGIIRASESDLNQCADGQIPEIHCLTYGINDGLPTLECSEGAQPAGARTADGRLWFPTAKGLVAIDPAHVSINTLPPPVILERMNVDDQPFAAPRATNAVSEVPPGRHRFDFQYAGLSFVAPEKVRFRYRLAGFDDAWIDAGIKRTASYNYIPPGNYSFQVVACNNDGVWNVTGAQMDFKVQPFFWQTAWFRLSALLLLISVSGGMVWFETRRRMRRKVDRLERQRDIERERARIARDIHDDLGSQLTRITMISESTRADLDRPLQAALGLTRIYDTARELTRSMDEIVWAINPSHDTLDSLAAYLEKFAQDWLATANIRCRLDLPVQFPDRRLTSEVRHNLFLACKEALHNVVKHSGASEVSIHITVGPRSFEVLIEDQGRGFSVASESSGNGLENMTRRLVGVGGNCKIDSAPGGGTRVNFIVPLPVAAS